ncbi:MAG: Ig-like domain-containing protein [Pseudomonadales bacterium]|nr:Ig-like domain-containing protein [Pseudomonadales bacterium]NRA14849.1 Ig-like domain-containing protein [Oceanospirillaceae bacterium]
MFKLVLIENLPGGIVNEIQLSLTSVVVFVAKADASYSVFDQSTMQPPTGLVLKRKQAELEIEVDQQLVVSIESFFISPAGTTSTAQFSIDGSTSESMLITADTASSLGEENIVWQLADEASSSFAPLAVSGIVLGTAAGTAGGSAAVAVAASSYNMVISASAGILQSLVTVKIYDKDGNLLATQEHNFSSGPLSFKITNGYQGPILAKVENSNGATVDYINEASNQLVDLGTDLRAMASSNGTDDVAINITPVTELAVRKAGITGNTLTAADLANNQKIADLFGIDDILGPAVTVLDTQYDASNGLSAAEKYGNLLAALAGSDDSSGGQKQTLDQLETQIVDNSSNLALTQEGVKLIKQGLDYFEGGVNAAKADLQNSLLMAPLIEQANDGLTLAEVNAGVLVQVAGAKIGDTVTLHWGDQVIIHTVLSLNAQNSVEITIASNIVSVHQGKVAVSAQINGGKQSPAVIIDVDSEAPTVTIIMTDSALKTGDTSLVTFTFSETPIGFAQDDISVQNGSLSDIIVNSTDDKIYTATFTPSADIEETTEVISVTGYLDEAGNTGTTNTSDSYTIDTTAPNVTITMADAALHAGETTLVTFTFDETPTGFTEGDVSVENGSLSDFTVTADVKVYTATFTPTPNIEDSTNIVSVGTGYTDTVGNTGTANTSDNYTIDITAPNVAITMADAALQAGESTLVTFTFDETPTGFTQGDVTVEKGSLSGFAVTADDKVYTATFTPTVNIEDSTNIVSVGTGYTDAAGNPGSANTSANYTIDTTAPTVAITMADTALKLGETALVTFTFSETPTDFTQGDVTVEKGSLSSFAVTANDKIYTATFTPDASIEDSTNIISVSTDYTDAIGNPGTVANSVNYSVDTLAPSLIGSNPQDEAASVSVSDNLVLTFSENIQFGSSGSIVLKATGANDIIIDVANHNNQLSISGATLTINPSIDLTAGIQYSIQIDASAVVDTADNNYPGIADETTLNFSTALDPSIVVFDLTDGLSSSHSGREFQANIDYTIYIQIDSVFDSNDRISFDSLHKWTGGKNLGAGDKIILVGTGTAITGHNANTLNYTQSQPASGSFYEWKTASAMDNQLLFLGLSAGGFIITKRNTTVANFSLTIWDGTIAAGVSVNIGTALPANVATSQGV